MDEPRRASKLTRKAGKSRGSRLEDDVQSVLKVGSDYYILASSVSANRSTRTLADGETFAVFETNGDFVESPLGSCGLFHRDARHLSRFEMRLGPRPPFFLNSRLSDDNLEFAANLTNIDLYKHGDEVEFQRGSVRVERNWTLTGSVLYGRICLHNFTLSSIRLPVSLFERGRQRVFGLSRTRRARPVYQVDFQSATRRTR
jgi:glycogen debranching enzyme